MMILSLIFSLFLSLTLEAAPVMKPMTDLGKVGNLSVARDFEAFKKEADKIGCKAQGSGHRVILTGFGLFSGVNYNISGAVVSSMADPEFFPSEIDLNHALKPNNTPPHDGILNQDKLGVKIVNRSLKINDENLEVCFIVANVNWDFAAAVFLDQAGRFKPELVLMTGRGSFSVSLEAGALNHADQSAGYSAQGVDLGSLNRPRTAKEKVLKDYALNKILPLTWNTLAVKNSIEAQVRELGFEVERQTTARPENDYICNNVSFILAHGSQNKSATLAGGTIVIPNFNFKIAPKVGFFHFPNVDSKNPNIKDAGSEIFTWTTVIAQAITSQFEK